MAPQKLMIFLNASFFSTEIERQDGVNQGKSLFLGKAKLISPLRKLISEHIAGFRFSTQDFQRVKPGS